MKKILLIGDSIRRGYDEAHSDAVHYYTSMGTEAFTKKVLSVLTPALNLSEIPEYKEKLYVKKPVGI